jgi:hypothetical protein
LADWPKSDKAVAEHAINFAIARRLSWDGNQRLGQKVHRINCGDDKQGSEKP